MQWASGGDTYAAEAAAILVAETALQLKGFLEHVQRMSEKR